MAKRAATTLVTLRRWFMSPDLVALRHEIRLSRRELGSLLTFYIPRLITPESPIVYLVNGFSANHKTFTFQPMRTTGAPGVSLAEYLAMQGFIVVVKDSEKSRLYQESSFREHAEKASIYAEQIVKDVPRLVQGGLNRELLSDGLHWVGHSMGGMEMMACQDRRFIKSVTVVGSPTYMKVDDKLVQAFAKVFALAPIPDSLLKRIPIPNTVVRNLVDQWMREKGLTASTRFNHDQNLLFGLFMHLPGVQTITHQFLNLDHMDFETSMAFIRSALADESWFLLKEFARALNEGESGAHKVLGLPIIPFEEPLMVITGEGDTIAPPDSCLNVLNYANHPIKEQVVYQSYDHLGLLVKYGALFDVWPVIGNFIRETHISGAQSTSKTTFEEFRTIIAQDASNPRLGAKARAFSKRSLHRLNAISPPKAKTGSTPGNSRSKAAIRSKGKD